MKLAWKAGWSDSTALHRVVIFGDVRFWVVYVRQPWSPY